MDEECDSSEKCNNGQCFNPCQVEKTCGLNALCRTDNHIVQCSCPFAFTGNQDVECVRSKFHSFYLSYLLSSISIKKCNNIYVVLVPRLCGGAGECENSHMCQDSMCVPKCKSDEECALNERCSKGACLRKYFIFDRNSYVAFFNTIR